MSILTKRLGYGIWGTIDGLDPQNPITVDSNKYTQALENNGNGDPIYVGEAIPGTAKSATGWRIKKITYSGTDITDVQWASGDSSFSYVWDNRATYTYS